MKFSVLLCECKYINRRYSKNMKKTFLVLLLVLCLTVSIFPTAVYAEQSSEEQVNLFDKNSSDNWLQALSYKGQKYTVSTYNYENMFATHEIAVTPGETLTWGPYGKENYCLEWWDSTGTYKGQVLTASTTLEPTGRTVKGVGLSDNTEYMLTYTFNNESDIAKIRILGNISTMDEFRVYSIKDPVDTAPAPLPLTPHETPNELNGKSILFVGDSIMSAQKDDYKHGGLAQRIGEWNKMKWTNKGVSGATVSTVKSNRIINQFVDGTFDYVIIQGGINDAMSNAQIGKLTEADVISGFDKRTFAGAFEELLSTAKSKYPTAKIGFIITYATPNSTWGGRTKDFSPEVNIMIKACEKWGIDYINLYSGKTADGKLYSKDILKTDTPENLYGKDTGEVHISGSGYDIIAPYIEEWIISLKSTAAPVEVTTEAPIDTDAPEPTGTTENTPAETDPAPDPAQTTPAPAPEKSGCASMVSLSALVFLIPAAFVVCKKRK